MTDKASTPPEGLRELKTARPDRYTGAQLDFEGGALNLDFRKSRGHFAFTDDQLEPVREYDKDSVWDGHLVRLPNAELEAIRDFLNKWLPPPVPHPSDEAVNETGRGGEWPAFGDLVENGWASEHNPTRRGYFVREFVRKGRMNPGRTWEVTDGKGKFWEFKPSDIGERLTVTSPPARLPSWLSMALEPFRLACDRYFQVQRHFEVSGATMAERRFSEGERDDTAIEAAVSDLQGVHFADLGIALTALSSEAPSVSPSEASGGNLPPDASKSPLQDEVERLREAVKIARGILLYPTNEMLTGAGILNTTGILAAADALLAVEDGITKPAALKANPHG